MELNKRFTYRQKIKQDLRQRFRNEYLGTLTHQKRKGKNCKTFDDVVLVGGDNAKSIDWPLARIKELYIGKDGHIRVAWLITATGEMSRPFQRPYPLELNNDCNSENLVQIATKKMRVTETSMKNDKPFYERKNVEIEPQAEEFQRRLIV